MIFAPPVPEQLAASPELAILHALEALLSLTERVLIAAHPDLDQVVFFPDAPPLSTEEWLADAILTHVNGLETAIGRYRAQLASRDQLRMVRPPSF
jgi:hypothetical protein